MIPLSFSWCVRWSYILVKLASRLRYINPIYFWCFPWACEPVSFGHASLSYTYCNMTDLRNDSVGIPWATVFSWFCAAWDALILINFWMWWERVAYTIWRHSQEVVMVTFHTVAIILAFHVCADLFDVYLPSHILPFRGIHVLGGQKWVLVLVLLIFFVLLLI